MTALPDRLIGEASGDVVGPTLIVIGGMHGNEPAGIAAARAAIAALDPARPGPARDARDPSD
ncbi:MAG TPA: hypothetical protein VFT22_27960 [Kofleriaceae bacterium]|nr:hypothetical protein [Kofleriaceae bacterium]